MLRIWIWTLLFVIRNFLESIDFFLMAYLTPSKEVVLEMPSKEIWIALLRDKCPIMTIQIARTFINGMNGKRTLNWSLLKNRIGKIVSLSMSAPLKARRWYRNRQYCNWLTNFVVGSDLLLSDICFDLKTSFNTSLEGMINLHYVPELPAERNLNFPTLIVSMYSIMPEAIWNLPLV